MVKELVSSCSSPHVAGMEFLRLRIDGEDVYLWFSRYEPSTFYRTLRQMEKDGMVSSSWDTSEGGPARRVYSITEAGEAYLKYWAESLDQYQRMMDTFFRLYTGRPTSKERKDQK